LRVRATEAEPFGSVRPAWHIFSFSCSAHTSLRRIAKAKSHAAIANLCNVVHGLLGNDGCTGLERRWLGCATYAWRPRYVLSYSADWHNRTMRYSALLLSRFHLRSAQRPTNQNDKARMRKNTARFRLSHRYSKKRV